MSETHYLYLITRDDGEKYVGVSKRPDVRFREHQLGWGSKSLKGRNFSMEILETGSEEYIYSIEEKTITTLRASLNVAKGGSGGGGNYASGSSNGSAKLTEQDVLNIRVAAAMGTSQAKLSRIYDVSASSISNICKHKVWKDVGGPITSGQANTFSKELIEAILDLRRQGNSYSTICRSLGISRYAAHKYCIKEGL